MPNDKQLIMVTDLGKEQKSAESIRFEKAGDAYLDLLSQLGELDSSEITDRNAPFIVGLIAARQLESHFLDTEDVTSREGNPSDPSYRKIEMENRGYTSANFRILEEARKGKFSKLRDFIKEKVDAWRDVAEDYLEGDEENQRYLQIARNLELVLGKTPLVGDGSAIKIPNPAHIERPVPLKVQLERFSKGEPIR